MASVVTPLILQLAMVWEVSQCRAARLSALPKAQMGRSFFYTSSHPVANTFPPVFRWQSVAIMLAHLPAALAGVSFMAATICTATFLRVESPCCSTPSIYSSAPLWPLKGEVGAPGYPKPGPPTCWLPCQLSTPAPPVLPHANGCPGGGGY
jgi:hypothetical protein